MSIRVVDYVLKHSRATSAPQQAVLLVIANECRGDDGTRAFPGLPLIAKGAKLSVRQTLRTIAQLECLGALTVERDRGGVNRYTVRMAEDAASISPVTSDVDVTTTRDVGVTTTSDISGADPCHTGHEPVTPVSPDPLRTVRQNRKERARRATPAAVVSMSSGLNGESETLTGTVEADDLQLVNTYARLWTNTHQADPHIDYPRDRRLMQDLLKQHTAEVIKAALGVYFASSDTWLLKNKHPLTTFRAQFNRYLPTAGRAAVLSQFGPKGAANAVMLREMLARSQAAGGER